jgi:protein-S-isoprenylcysteine O-methyltransferase Ste14
MVAGLVVEVISKCFFDPTDRRRFVLDGDGFPQTPDGQTLVYRNGALYQINGKQATSQRAKRNKIALYCLVLVPVYLVLFSRFASPWMEAAVAMLLPLCVIALAVIKRQEAALVRSNSAEFARFGWGEYYLKISGIQSQRVARPLLAAVVQALLALGVFYFALHADGLLAKTVLWAIVAFFLFLFVMFFWLAIVKVWHKQNHVD